MSSDAPFLRLVSKDGITEPVSLLALRVLGREIAESRLRGLDWVAQRFCDRYMPGPDGPDFSHAVDDLVAMLRCEYEEGYQEGKAASD